ncbi:fatty acid desaturase family protein [Actinorugispora endophytica]|uniref:Fatty acid desaturase n=1 Tax=Actinorugispora endophytica TaxID=1605990 RepID=A0A4R6V3K2_9ACTN|nr:acyl-CoA desaturase [Actinorugispora endophytica]TDQ53288.1 fatty acid desaturase [Actinorugispora endophytica]
MASGPEGAVRGSSYAELSRQMKRAGLLERRAGHYAVRIAVNAAFYAGCWTAFALIGDSWWQMATAVLLGVAFTQSGFLGHDAGHRQVSASRRVNDAVGLLHGNAMIGIAYGWWVGKHNRHHSHPNELGHDPDLAIGVLAFDDHQVPDKRGLTRFTVKYQAFLFLPLLLLEGWSLHWESAKAAWRGEGRRPVLERALLLGHGAAYLAAVLLVLPPGKAALFVLVHQGVFGLYMGCSFAPNHKGMPVLPSGTRMDFLRRQVTTSRNIRGHWLTDAVLGGLNYQIEHHLFPSMPRRSLRRAQRIVQEHCEEHGIAYTSTTFLGSFREVFSHLHAVGAPLRSGS